MPKNKESGPVSASSKLFFVVWIKLKPARVGERCVRIAEVDGSIPFRSTNIYCHFWQYIFFTIFIEQHLLAMLWIFVLTEESNYKQKNAELLLGIFLHLIFNCKE